jgi:hypothetical protein
MAIVLITVNSVGRTAIVVQDYCTQIAVGELTSVGGWPTTALLVSQSALGPQRSVPGGEGYIFMQRGSSGVEQYVPGQIAGYVQTATGSTTCYQDEGGDV